MAAELQKSIDALAEAQNAVSGLEGMEALEGISEEQAGSGIDVDALNQAAGTIRENLASFAASAAELQEQIPELEAKLERTSEFRGRASGRQSGDIVRTGGSSE